VERPTADDLRREEVEVRPVVKEPESPLEEKQEDEREGDRDRKKKPPPRTRNARVGIRLMSRPALVSRCHEG